jgi:hypothetical protein
VRAWEFFFAVYLRKTPGEEDLCQVSNWGHPAKKGSVIPSSSGRVTRQLAALFAEYLLEVLGKEPVCRVLIFTECNFYDAPCF